MTIKQFHATYLVNEDRILFRFNTQDSAEYRLWFTRRVTLFILAATAHLLAKKMENVHSLEAVKALAEFEKQAISETSIDQASGPSTFESGTHFPIGADALLVMDVSCSLTKNGEKLAQIPITKDQQLDDALSIDFLLPGGATLNLKLPQKLLKSVRSLLDRLRQGAGWGEAILQDKNVEKTQQNLGFMSSHNGSIH